MPLYSNMFVAVIINLRFVAVIEVVAVIINLHVIERKTMYFDHFFANTDAQNVHNYLLTRLRPAVDTRLQ